MVTNVSPDLVDSGFVLTPDHKEEWLFASLSRASQDEALSTFNICKPLYFHGAAIMY
ncbi:unnamed protein product [Protopolystoma xenopodis]|uniref:Uncharacterized protein n=1 Tax=Protopolystoma xenopodis TaxID=117903 RepID=A0A3S5FEX4_9PLAT|nr:unnamed protein product [Protopolystoma xenopodis]